MSLTHSKRRHIIALAVMGIALLTTLVATACATHQPSEPPSRRTGTLSNSRWKYEGEIIAGKPDGYGVCRYTNGDVYYGSFKGGYKDGLGRLMHHNGKIEFGEWKHGSLKKPSGQKFTPGDKAYGIDVSRHQSTVKWHELALYADAHGNVYSSAKTSDYLQPVLFAFIKSTEGASLKDPTFKSNFENAKKWGIIRGAYHFLSLNASVDQQVKNYIDHTPLKKGDLPPVLDLEIDKQVMIKEHKKVCEMALQWLKKIKKHYGVEPIIYTYQSYYNDYLRGKGFDEYDVWIARFSNQKPSVKGWEIWQFTETGKVRGITGKADIDLYNGSYKSLKNYVTKKGIKK